MGDSTSASDGPKHGGHSGTADHGSFRYARLLRGRGSLVRWDQSTMAFARWVPGTEDRPGHWFEDPALIDYFVGDDRIDAVEIEANQASAFIEAGAPLG
jgi:hypothetical protein